VKSAVKAASPPVRPVLIFDGDCRFCGIWIRRWRCLSGSRVDYLPFQAQAVTERFPELSRQQLERAVHLVSEDGSIYSGAEAALRALAYNPHEQWLLDWYQHSGAFSRAAERAYRFVAAHRQLFSLLTRLGWGDRVEPASYALVRTVFIRGLALIYLAAFISLWSQIGGLIGSQGILPAHLTMQAVRQQSQASGIGLDRYRIFPTLCWFNDSDRSLNLQCAGGTVLALLVFAGIAPAPCLFLLWVIYLSLSSVSREFLGFQWDILLLETGFLAVFFAPLRFLPWRKSSALPSTIVLWLLRWLLFRLMFESGCVKLLSGDPAWRNLTALNFHYETQPLPTWIAWYAHQLPAWIHKTSTLLMFITELVVPFFIFAPRRLRHVAGLALIALQVLIFLTGNYCFFNLLAVILCITLFDDFALRNLFRFKGQAPGSNQQPLNAAEPLTETADSSAHMPCNNPSTSGWRWPLPVTVPLACLATLVSFAQLGSMFLPNVSLPPSVAAVHQWLGPFRTFNSYGLFAVMTKSRPEIIVQGSADGTTWLDYEFKYKPGDLRHRPGFVAPHQPRLDWQMWFAALGSYRSNPWFVRFCGELLKNSPEVVAQLKQNPFPGAPPRYVRAVVYDYHFTDFSTRRSSGAWWRREFKGEYLPIISLRNDPPD
jgi:predicted DCC family thiol-disulfide oxidoreductase YuxK